ncbi:MAG TPA: class I SAM-dependent methyltransferase [Burkholderiales bacterium]|nr:class I SAM-dependent methyltransferase [Burkholderiales bacterium]
MRSYPRNRMLAALALGAALSLAAHAVAAAEKEYQPVVGQEGKDVIWVPTPEKTVEKMLAVANVGPSDMVIDLGCGDGRIVIAAAKRGARAFGVDMNPDMIKLSERHAAADGVTERAKFYVRDIFETDLKPATVVTMYLLPQLNLRLRPTLLALKPGTRIVSHAFDMADWEPDVYDTSTGNSVRLWIVPAKVSGSWSWQMNAAGGERSVSLDLDQTYQKLTGSVKAGGKLALRDAKLAGDAISFSLVDESAGGARYDFSGHVNGGVIDGSVKSGNGATAKWHATRNSS